MSRNNLKPQLFFSLSGLRGIVGESLTPELALKYASAFGNLCRGGKVVMGRDTRVSGEMLKYAVMGGLLSVGCEVVDIGVCPTPTVEMAVLELKSAGGIVITASHNPIEWNALKFLNSSGMFLNPSQKNKLETLANNKLEFKAYNKIGNVEYDLSQIEKHIQKLFDLKIVLENQIQKRKYKIVVDCCNGAGYFAVPWMLSQLNCQVIELNCIGDGNFPHNPEPVPQNLAQLCQSVKKYKADLGIAVDPDVDRLALVDEKGNALSEEYTLALATDFVLSRSVRGAVVVNSSTSKMLEDLADKYKVSFHRTPVGEAYVAEKLKKVKGAIGGEGNGGVILPELHYGRDALAGIALILSYLAQSRKRLSQLVKALPVYHQQKKFLPLEKNWEGKIRKLKNQFKTGKLSTLDGWRWDFGSSWLQIRKSNTEPKIRVIAEAKDKKILQELFLRVAAIMNNTLST